MRDRFFLYAFIAALFFMLFLAGGISTYFKYFPYSWIDEAVTAKNALIKQNKIIEKQLREENATNKSSYRVIINKNKSDPSYILLTGFTMRRALLIDTSGKKIHQWQYGTIQGTYWRDLHAFPNGDLLVVRENDSKTPHGQSLIKLDKNSKLMWEYKAHVHHAIHVQPNNNILILEHRFSDNLGEVTNVKLGSKYLSDYAVTLSQDGKKIYEISILDAILKSPYKEWLINTRKNKEEWDITHTNSITSLNKKMAAAFPMFNAGDILISIRSLNAIAVIDPKTNEIKWAKKFIWKMQHDAEFLNDGSIMLFDNIGKSKNESRILKYFPENNAIQIVYAGSKQKPFKSYVMGAQQLLENGNILVTESTARRVLEINPKTKNILWKLKSHKKKRFISPAHKYSPDYFTFLSKTTQTPNHK